MHRNKHVLAGFAGGKFLRRKDPWLFPHGEGLGLPKPQRKTSKRQIRSEAGNGVLMLNWARHAAKKKLHNRRK